MQLKKHIVLALAFIGLAIPAMADSPLTSTSFADAYQNEPMVQKAATAPNGILTEELAAYLADGKQPIDVKMAVINQLSWSFDGKANAAVFRQYLLGHGYKSDKDFKKRGKAHELIAMAYLQALDNYFDVTEAVAWAELAVKKDKKSYTVQLIAALIKAQRAMDSDWCKVYRLVDGVRTNAMLTNDMKEEASAIVFEYMDLYASSCE
jgi:hypothetical protein